MKGLLIILLFIPIVSFSQFEFIDSIPVQTKEGVVLDNAWTGGLNSSQFNTMDLNNDGFEDLVIIERNTYTGIKCYLNDGISDSISYTYAPQYEKYFPEFGNWGRLVDYDCDGKKDLFTHRSAGIRVYKNTSTDNELSFTMTKDMIYSGNKVNLYASSGLIPVFYDIDSDGDIDVFTFGVGSNSIEWHKNLSMENYGICDSLEYARETECWGHILDNEISNEVILHEDCGNRGQKAILHANNLLYMEDFDRDNDLDVVIGNHYINEVIYLENIGSNDIPIFDSYEGGFPQSSISISVPNFPYVTILDLDNDNVKELIASPNTSFGSDNISGIWLYEHSNTTPGEYTFVKKGFLQDQTIDFGEGLNVHFVDMNQDGLEDILAGNFYMYEDSNKNTYVSLLMNIGTPTSPRYEITDSNFVLFEGSGNYNSTVATGDLDNDGILEIVIGTYIGTVNLYKNLGTVMNPQYELRTKNYGGMDIGSYANPQLVDINEDGLLDLLIGNESGQLYYYENEGTIDSAIFTSEATIDTFANVGYNRSYGTRNAAPHYFNSNDTSYLFVGTQNGYIYQYFKDDDNYVLYDSLDTKGMTTTLSSADINNDGELEFLIGDGAGGLRLLSPTNKKAFYTNIDIDCTKEWNRGNSDLMFYPNPSHYKINIISAHTITEIGVYNSNGQFIKKAHSQHQLFINDLRNGLYILEFKDLNGIVSRKKLIKH